MYAMEMEAPGRPLQQVWRQQLPQPTAGQVRLRVKACGVCRTDLHIVDGDLPFPGQQVVPGHEVVGVIDAMGNDVSGLMVGQRVGVPWLGWTCGTCELCRSGHENLCEQARFTGYQIHGGYASHVVADARYVFPIPDQYNDLEAAPLLCAGLIGFRALRMAADALKGPKPRLGLYGFGAAAHLVIQMARFEGCEVYAFTREGDESAQALARQLGAVWAGPSEAKPPVALDAALLFAPVGSLVPLALQAIRPAGVVVCAGIHMSDIPSFPYAWLWKERRIVSVANLTRADGDGFMALASACKLDVTAHPYAMTEANQALDDLRAGRFSGAAVLVP
ncbi:MAG: zinc-dependent alcohol dehydrogenase family protein [Aquabacterium sp.]|uniref:zinc-dependent alcohol dehydrogenase family protein n=1 Tax=Aquabacterium sp. TaxID=1872578 RepID=UPI003BCB33B2